MKYELTRISGVDLLHSAQISPPTTSDEQIQIVEEKDSDEEENSPQVSRKWSLPLRRRPRRVDTNVIFTGLEGAEEYSVTITTIINGKRIVSLTKALVEVDKSPGENSLKLTE